MKANWQPMGTAPRDGREILAWNGDICMLLSWNEYRKVWSSGVNGDYETWQDSDFIYWTDLPDPPGEILE